MTAFFTYKQLDDIINGNIQKLALDVIPFAKDAIIKAVAVDSANANGIAFPRKIEVFLPETFNAKNAGYDMHVALQKITRLELNKEFNQYGYSIGYISNIDYTPERVPDYIIGKSKGMNKEFYSFYFYIHEYSIEKKRSWWFRLWWKEDTYPLRNGNHGGLK